MASSKWVIKAANYFMLKPSNVVILLLSVFLVLYHSTALIIVQSWSDSAYSHGVILWPLSCYFAFLQWRRNRDVIQFSYSFSAIILLVSISLIWFVASLVYVEMVQQVAFVLLIALLIFALFGLKVTRLFLFPILLLFSAVPIWDRLNDYLQIAATDGAEFFLRMASDAVFGFSVLREGNLLTIPAGSFEVAGSCSGLRYIIVGVTLPLIHGYILRFPPLLMAIYALLGGLLAYIANAMRVAIIVIVGELSDMKSSLVDDHLWLGWVIFAIVIFTLVVLVEKYLYSLGKEEAANAAPVGDAGGDAMSIKVAYFIPLIVALSIGPIMVYLYQPNGALPAPISMTVPSSSEWGARQVEQGEWVPDFERPGAYIGRANYRFSSGEEVNLYLSHYLWQEPGREAVSVVNRVYGKDKWSEIYHKNIEAVLFGEEPLYLEETLIRRGATGGERLVWRWYLVNDYRTANKYLAKVLNAWSILKGDPAITVFVVATDIEENYPVAAERMRQFIVSEISAWEDWVDRLEGQAVAGW